MMLKSIWVNADTATGIFGSTGTDYREQFMNRIMKNISKIATIDWNMPWFQNASNLTSIIPSPKPKLENRKLSNRCSLSLFGYFPRGLELLAMFMPKHAST